MGAERVKMKEESGNVKLREKKQAYKLNMAHETRFLDRITAQSRLVDSQNCLPGRLVAAGADGCKQIGVITGELEEVRLVTVWVFFG